MLIAAILAFLPVLAVEFFVDSYVRKSSEASVLRALNSISTESQSAIYEGLTGIGRVISSSPSLCTPTFMQSLHGFLLHAQFMQQFVVENSNGVEYCNAYDLSFDYQVRSRELTMPGRDETVAAVRTTTGDNSSTFYRISRSVGNGNHVSAFVQFPNSLLTNNLPDALVGAAFVRVAMSDGTELLVAGDPSVADQGAVSRDYLFSNAFAGDLPIRVESAISFETLQARYTDLYLSATLVACMLSAFILLMVYQAVKRGSMPDFDLERAIVNNEIVPFYQPLIDISTGRVVGCEVLVRWIKPNGKTIPPAAFIEYAEVTGLAIPMTLRIMERVREEMTELSETNPGLKISINLFGGHFRDTNIVEDVQAIFGGSKISYRQLVFEITERQPLDDEQSAMSVIAGLRALGARIALDDLGTGHSNLAYLQTLGLDIVKIDRIFIEMIDGSDVSAPVLEGLINMGHELGAELIAEGVETEEQAKFLRAHGVNQVQGFMFAAALPVDKYIRMVRAVNGVVEAPHSERKVSLASAA